MDTQTLSINSKLYVSRGFRYIYVDDPKKTGHLFNLDLIEREDARLCH